MGGRFHSPRRLVLLVLAVLAGTGVLAAPAQAARSEGTATIRLVDHGGGRTLSGQGVKILPRGPATRVGRNLELPISDVFGFEPGNATWAVTDGRLVFRKGKRRVALSDIELDLSPYPSHLGRTLRGKLAGRRIDVLRLERVPRSLGNGDGGYRLENARLRLTPEAAEILKRRLGLQRALRLDGVGMAWLSAQKLPVRDWARAVDFGSVEASGLSLPVTGGTYEQGFFGATDKLVLKAQGSATFARSADCIVTVNFADLTLTIDGANSSIVAGDYSYSTERLGGADCDLTPPVPTPGATIATLDVSGVTPIHGFAPPNDQGVDRQTATWNAIPATLTAAGAAILGPQYQAGQPFGPVTVVAGWNGPFAVP